MHRVCGECRRGYDDAKQHTRCPHSPLWDPTNDYCAQHDLVHCPFHPGAEHKDGGGGMVKTGQVVVGSDGTITQPAADRFLNRIGFSHLASDPAGYRTEEDHNRIAAEDTGIEDIIVPVFEDEYPRHP